MPKCVKYAFCLYYGDVCENVRLKISIFRLITSLNKFTSNSYYSTAMVKEYATATSTRKRKFQGEGVIHRSPLPRTLATGHNGSAASYRVDGQGATASNLLSIRQYCSEKNAGRVHFRGQYQTHNSAADDPDKTIQALIFIDFY